MSSLSSRRRRPRPLRKFCGYTLPDQDVVDWVKRDYNSTTEHSVSMAMALLAEHIESAYPIRVKVWGSLEEPIIVVLSRPSVRDPSATFENFTHFEENIRDQSVKRILSLEGFHDMTFNTWVLGDIY